MIFVTTGTQKFQFNRLIDRVIELAAKNVTSDDFFCQYGYSKFNSGTNIKGERFLNETDFENVLEKCWCLITHSGTGNVIKALKLKKKVIIVPRLKKYGEHIDDHQLELAMFIKENNYGLVVTNIADLDKALINITKMKFKEFKSDNERLMNDINAYIETKI